MNKSVSKKQCEADPFSLVGRQVAFGILDARYQAIDGVGVGRIGLCDGAAYCAIGHLNGVIQIVACVGDSVSAFGDGEIFYATNQAI